MYVRIGFGLYQSCGNRGSGGRVSMCFGCGGVEWVGGLDQGLEERGGGRCVSCESGFAV